MKFLYNLAAVLPFLALFHGSIADPDNTAVFYVDKSVSMTDLTECIPLVSDIGVDVDFIVFGYDVQCNTYSTNTCSETPLNSNPLSFKASVDNTADKFGEAVPHGAIKCTTDPKANPTPA